MPVYTMSLPLLHKLNKIPEKVVDCQGAMKIMVSIMNRDKLEKINKLFNTTYMIRKYNKQCSFIQIHI